jgi:molybdate transport system ATP-binding protein
VAGRPASADGAPGGAPHLDLDVRLSLGRLGLAFTLRSEARRLAVIGASGAGKSTLLRVVAGLERGARGRVVVDGTAWQDDDRGIRVPPWRRRVGWVPQDSILFPHVDVRANLGWTAPDPAALDHVARVLEIDGLLGRRPRNLSGGERQRVALGRAILARPKLLLLDEPFAAVDKRLRGRLVDELGQLSREADLPFILVSHDDTDVAALADAVWRVADGRLEKV